MFAMAGIELVVTYECFKASSGTVLPTMAPIFGAQTPVQFTTLEVEIVPKGVFTPDTLLTPKSSTFVSISGRML